eukprot:76805_1
MPQSRKRKRKTRTTNKDDSRPTKKHKLMQKETFCQESQDLFQRLNTMTTSLDVFTTTFDWGNDNSTDTVPFLLVNQSKMDQFNAIKKYLPSSFERGIAWIIMDYAQASTPTQFINAVISHYNAQLELGTCTLSISSTLKQYGERVGDPMWGELKNISQLIDAIPYLEEQGSSHNMSLTSFGLFSRQRIMNPTLRSHTTLRENMTSIKCCLTPRPFRLCTFLVYAYCVSYGSSTIL